MMQFMGGPGKVFVRTDSVSEAKSTLAELVLAWARDVATGMPTHILELGPERRGAKSGCECPSCGLPLLAVNAAKTEFVRRPHFRHPEGAQREECLVLAARAAAMRQIRETGWIELPRRSKSAKARGLSGEVYEAWVERPAERVRITEVNFRDRAFAVLTLDNGRELRVELTGTLGAGADLVLDGNGLPVPTILLSIDDPRLAGMDANELRRQMRLLPDALCWRAHWDDADLDDEAAAAAHNEALINLDEVPDELDLPPDLEPALKRQTVLHHEAMKLLASSRQIRVPSWVAAAKITMPDGRVARRHFESAPERLSLDQVKLEKRFGHIVPDVSCEARPVVGGAEFSLLFIEVTVTNTMTEERIERIRDASQSTLEVDLSLAGGRIDREGLRRLVVDDLDLKHWLFHPQQVRCAASLSEELETEVAKARATAERRAKLRTLPLTDLIFNYLDAALQLADAEASDNADACQPQNIASEIRTTRAALAEAVEALDAHGYPEAGDANLLGMRGMIARILSIQLARPIGFQVDKFAGEFDVIEQLQRVRDADASIYLIAIRAYRPPLTRQQQSSIDEWAGKVRDSLKRGEATYCRNPSYDRLLSILFPEMAGGLAKPGAKRKRESLSSHGDSRAGNLASMSGADREKFRREAWSDRDWPQQRYLDTGKKDPWLKGRDLEAWKIANPESARRWFGDDDR